MRVGVDVSATIADTAVPSIQYRESEKSGSDTISQAVEKDFDTCNQDEAPVQPGGGGYRTVKRHSVLGRVELLRCVASPRSRREPPCSLSTRTSCYPSLKLRPPQTPGLDRTAALAGDGFHYRHARSRSF